MGILSTQKVQQTSPAAPSANGTVLGTFVGLLEYDAFFVEAQLQGATGGTLDIYLQRLITTPDGAKQWEDWAHYPQLAAAAAQVTYGFNAEQAIGSTTIAQVGISADVPATPPVLAANTFLGGHPGDQVRVLAVAGAGTSVGAQQTVYLTQRASSKRAG